MKAILAILSFVTLISRKYRLSSCPSEKSKSALLLVLCPLSTSGQGASEGWLLQYCDRDSFLLCPCMFWRPKERMLTIGSLVCRCEKLSSMSLASMKISFRSSMNLSQVPRGRLLWICTKACKPYSKTGLSSWRTLLLSCFLNKPCPVD